MSQMLVGLPEEDFPTELKGELVSEQTYKERHEIMKEYGVPCGSLDAIFVNFKQLRRNGLSLKQVRTAVNNLHPILMKNLRLDRYGTVIVMDSRARWYRRGGWVLPCKRHRWGELHHGIRFCRECPETQYEGSRKS